MMLVSRKKTQLNTRRLWRKGKEEKDIDDKIRAREEAKYDSPMVDFIESAETGLVALGKKRGASSQGSSNCTRVYPRRGR